MGALNVLPRSFKGGGRRARVPEGDIRAEALVKETWRLRAAGFADGGGPEPRLRQPPEVGKVQKCLPTTSTKTWFQNLGLQDCKEAFSLLSATEFPVIHHSSPRKPLQTPADFENCFC
jgi:hypothetical protein